MASWARNLLLVVAAVGAAAATALATVAGNASTGSHVPWLPSMDQHYLRWLLGSVFAVAGATLFGLWVQRRYELGLQRLLPAVQRPESWMVDRPAEIGVIVRALRRRRGPSTIGVTTAVHGAGGFGKSTVARMVRADPRILRRFGRRVYWVTLGRDARRGALVEKVNDLVRQIDPALAHPYTDLGQAADHLASVLATGPRRLVIIDDVWFSDQLAVFPVSGRCGRLVTTRVASLVSTEALTVRVDQMSVGQARTVLTADLPLLPGHVVDGLMVEAGRWPLLLRLINKIVVEQCRTGADAASVAEHLWQRLRRDGALQVDALTGVANQQVDVSDPEQRRLAVAATIEASVGLLSAHERDRFAELAIFAEDEAMSLALLELLWRATGDMDAMAARALCARIGDLALLTHTDFGIDAAVGLHDVVRDYLRGELGADRLRTLNDILLSAVAADLPSDQPLVNDDERTQVIAWWCLPDSARYLWDHLLEHLVAAGRENEADATAADLRWVAARLQLSGATGPLADLTKLGSARAGRLSRLFGQIAHLLAPTVPEHSRIDVLYSRVAHDPDWSRQTAILAAQRNQPALTNRWALPDLAPSDLRRTLTGHTGSVTAVVISPDGSWLASGASDGQVHIWDVTTGQQRLVLPGHVGGVTALVASPDGTWLASGAGEGPVAIWDVSTGQLRSTLAEHSTRVTSLNVSPHGTWVAIGANDGSLEIWDTETAELRTGLRARSKSMTAVAISPTGTWLATGSENGSLFIRDVATGEQLGALRSHLGRVNTVVVAPDGTWFATGGEDRSVQIWDVVTGQRRATLTGHTHAVNALAVSPDSRWLVTADNSSVRIWNVANGKQYAELAAENESVTTLAVAPDGTWMATGGTAGLVQIWDGITGDRSSALSGHAGRVTCLTVAADGSWIGGGGPRGIRIWDATSGLMRTNMTGNTSAVAALAAAPDGTWLASGSGDGSVWIWDTATGQPRLKTDGHARAVNTVRVASDGTWLASASNAGWVRIWHVLSGELRTALGPHPRGTNNLAIAPDGSWLATAGNDRSIRIWNAETGQQQSELKAGTPRIYALAIAPDGRWLAASGDNYSVWIWEIATGQVRLTLNGHTDRVNAVAIAPNGVWLATVGNDRTIRVWHGATGAAVAIMRVDARPRSCDWTPDGRRIVVGGDAGVYHFEFGGATTPN